VIVPPNQFGIQQARLLKTFFTVLRMSLRDSVETAELILLTETEKAQLEANSHRTLVVVSWLSNAIFELQRSGAISESRLQAIDSKISELMNSLEKYVFDVNQLSLLFSLILMLCAIHFLKCV
jgi:predicted membrane chloride channel (bestrophin family)